MHAVTSSNALCWQITIVAGRSHPMPGGCRRVQGVLVMHMADSQLLQACSKTHHSRAYAASRHLPRGRYHTKLMVQQIVHNWQRPSSYNAAQGLLNQRAPRRLFSCMPHVWDTALVLAGGTPTASTAIQLEATSFPIQPHKTAAKQWNQQCKLRN